MANGATHQRLIDVGLALLEKHGIAVVVLLALVLWFVAADANWIDSNARSMRAMQVEQRQALAELAATTERLAAHMDVLARAQIRQNAFERELWCWTVVKNRDLLNQCLGNASGPGRPTQ